MTSRVTRRRLLTGATASVIAASLPTIAVEAKPAFLRGGHPVAIPPAGLLTTFQLVENGGMPSKGFHQMGLPLREGDVPVGSRLKIQRGGVDVPAQFDARSSWTWGDGSLRFCVAWIRDADFSANEVRIYSLISESGSFDNSTSMTLATALAGTDLKVEITNFSGATSGAFPDHLVSLNDHATVPTRITKYAGGGIADIWEIWGMAQNGGVEHAHLKSISYFAVLKNADGSINDRKYVAVLSQDWWSIAGKETLTYTATLKNGATVIETYGGAFNDVGVRSATVQHLYHQQWATVRLTVDHQHAMPHWLSGSPPSLTYKPDRVYWIATGLMPPFDLTTAYVMPTAYGDTGTNLTNTGFRTYKVAQYQPGSAQAHRASVDGTGGYAGEEIVPNMDGIAFALQTPINYRIARVNNFVNLHSPEHRRSNRTRTRPIAQFPDDAGASDIANTVVSLRLTDERGDVGTPTSYYDFTADGMPIAVNASTVTALPSIEKDSWVAPPLDRDSGTTRWTISNESTHYVDYGYFMYLHEGERYFLQAMLNRTMDAVQQTTQPQPLKYYGFYPGVPSTPWHAYGILFSQNSERNLGRSARAVSGAALIPDDDVQTRCIRALIHHNARWMDAHVDYIPASYNGCISPQNALFSHWMEGLNTANIYTAWDRTGNPLFRRMAEKNAIAARHYAEIDRIGTGGSYQAISRPSMANPWDATTNDWFADGAIFQSAPGASVTASDNRITVTPPRSQPYTDGGFLIFSDTNPEVIPPFVPKPIPPEVSLGKIYTITNGISSTSCQIIDPDTSAIVEFTDNMDNVCIGLVLNSSQDPHKSTGIQAGGDDYILVHRFGLVIALLHGHPTITQTHLDRYDTYVNNSPVAWSAAQWCSWNMSAANPVHRP